MIFMISDNCMDLYGSGVRGVSERFGMKSRACDLLTRPTVRNTTIWTDVRHDPFRDFSIVFDDLSVVVRCVFDDFDDVLLFSTILNEL